MLFFKSTLPSLLDRLIHKYYGIPMEDPEIDHKRVSLNREYRFIYPEFLPDNKDWSKRNKLCEMLQRQDMINRRKVLNIPEFYVGSILKVTVSDFYAPDKLNKFLGICVIRGGSMLRHFFILRNVIDGLGVEISYDMYNPTIQSIEVLKLEKRLDDHLLYLRDALPEYSTFDVNMPKIFHSIGDPVPINPIKVQLKPLPWSARWELFGELQGLQDFTHHLKKYQTRIMKKNATPWEKYDIMRQYRENVTKDDQTHIFQHVQEHETAMKGFKKSAPSLSSPPLPSLNKMAAATES